MLKRINTALVILIVAINLYSITLPLFPMISFWLRSKTSRIEQTLSAQISSPDTPVPKENRLVIPRLMLDEPILDGPSVATVDKGVWRRPRTSSPERGSNTVLVGHRFRYQGAAVFYHLDLVKTGDELAVYWNGQKFLYKVRETKIVPPSEISVEAPTEGNILTLYTCTPLWTSKDRLVVIAERIN